MTRLNFFCHWRDPAMAVAMNLSRRVGSRKAATMLQVSKQGLLAVLIENC